jgi:hypothetical protein
MPSPIVAATGGSAGWQSPAARADCGASGIAVMNAAVGRLFVRMDRQHDLALRGRKRAFYAAQIARTRTGERESRDKAQDVRRTRTPGVPRLPPPDSKRSRKDV